MPPSNNKRLRVSVLGSCVLKIDEPEPFLGTQKIKVIDVIPHG
jgi:hypothetical protein